METTHTKKKESLCITRVWQKSVSVTQLGFMLGIKFIASRQFSASKSPTSCGRKTLIAMVK